VIEKQFGRRFEFEFDDHSKFDEKETILIF